jgi:hypothetical protein
MYFSEINAGNIVLFNDIEYIVLKNFGNCGLVRENSEFGVFINNFEWKENLIVLEEKIDSIKVLDLINEFHSFF